MSKIEYLVQKKVVRWCSRADWVTLDITPSSEAWKEQHPNIDASTVKFIKREICTPDPEKFQLSRR